MDDFWFLFLLVLMVVFLVTPKPFMRIVCSSSSVFANVGMVILISIKGGEFALLQFDVFFQEMHRKLLTLSFPIMQKLWML